MMRLMREDQILSADFRRQVIKEITGNENIKRKNEHLKRHEIYKDKTSKYVIEKLKKEGLKDETVELMSNRAGNVSICRKIVDKLARTYLGGVQREVEADETVINDQLSELSRLLCIDKKMKKADRYLELHKNCMIQVTPLIIGEGGENIMKPHIRILAPWQYDVIEGANDRETAKVVILSDFSDGARPAMPAPNEAETARHISRSTRPDSDGIDNIIADDPNDSDRYHEFAWFSDNYHFTTDINGEIVQNLSPENGENVIGMLPFVNVAADQDGEFWAEGGDDIVDGSILVNTLITDMFGIAYIQGYGQVVVSGKNLPSTFRMGPHSAVLLEYDKDEDPKPDVTVLNSNPPLDLWMRSIEQYVALLLSTNSLSPSSLSTRLDAANFPSGIAMLVEMSEATTDIEDKQKDFKDIEREVWRRIIAWQNILIDRNVAPESFKDIGTVNLSEDISVRFTDPKPVVSEQERLGNIEKRKGIGGLNEEVDYILMDNPDMTRDEAEKKLLRIKEEELKSMSAQIEGSMAQMEEDEEMPPEDAMDEEEENMEEEM